MSISAPELRAVGADLLARWGSLERRRLRQMHGYPKQSPIARLTPRANYWQSADVPIIHDGDTAIVERHLPSLPDDERAAVVMYYALGAGPARIARELGLRPTGVQSRLHRAQKALGIAIRESQAAG